MRILLFLLCLPISVAFAEINIERFELSGEYGLAYHSLEGTQKSNNSKGRLTSPQFPYWNGALTTRLSQNWGVRFFGGLQFVRFNEPPGTEQLKSERQDLIHYGIEVITKTGANSRLGYFLMQQERPLYFTKTAGEFAVIKEQFGQAGLSWTLHQRRRVGVLWAAGVKGFVLFPAAGGDVVTESGAGGEGFARLGYIGPMGTSYLLKGFYQVATAPNADINFNHEVFGYALQINFTF